MVDKTCIMTSNSQILADWLLE